MAYTGLAGFILVAIGPNIELASLPIATLVAVADPCAMHVFVGSRINLFETTRAFTHLHGK